MEVKTLKDFLSKATILYLVKESQSCPAWKEDIEEYLDSYNNGEILGIRDIMKCVTLPVFPLGLDIKEEMWNTLGEESSKFTYNNLLAYYSVLNSPQFELFSPKTKEMIRLAVKGMISQIKRQVSIYGVQSEVFTREINDRRELVKKQFTNINRFMRDKIENEGMILLPAENKDGTIIYPDNGDVYAYYATKPQLMYGPEAYDEAYVGVLLHDNKSK